MFSTADLEQKQKGCSQNIILNKKFDDRYCC